MTAPPAGPFQRSVPARRRRHDRATSQPEQQHRHGLRQRVRPGPPAGGPRAATRPSTPTHVSDESGQRQHRRRPDQHQQRRSSTGRTYTRNSNPTTAAAPNRDPNDAHSDFVYPSTSSRHDPYIRQDATARAVGQRDPAAGPLHRAGQLDVLQHRRRAPPRARRPRRRPTGAPPGTARRPPPATAAPSAPSPAAAGTPATTIAAAAARAARPTTRATIRGYGVSRSDAGRPQQRRRARHRVAARAPRRRRRTPGPRPAGRPRRRVAWQACGLPSQPAGSGAPVQQPHPRVAAGHRAHQVGRAVGRAVVEHQDRQRGYAALGQQRPQARLDPVRLVAHRQQHRDRCPHSGRRGRAAQQPRVHRDVQRERAGEHDRQPGERAHARTRATAAPPAAPPPRPCRAPPHTADPGSPRNTACASTEEQYVHRYSAYIAASRPGRRPRPRRPACANTAIISTATTQPAEVVAHRHVRHPGQAGDRVGPGPVALGDHLRVEEQVPGGQADAGHRDPQRGRRRTSRDRGEPRRPCHPGPRQRDHPAARRHLRTRARRSTRSRRTARRRDADRLDQPARRRWSPAPARPRRADRG